VRKNWTTAVLDWRHLHQYHWLVLHNKLAFPHQQHEIQHILHLHANKTTVFHKLCNADHIASLNFENCCNCGICGGGRSLSLTMESLKIPFLSTNCYWIMIRLVCDMTTMRFIGHKFITMCNTYPASISWTLVWWKGNLCLFKATACVSSQFTYC
jgi:hypothetical protein